MATETETETTSGSAALVRAPDLSGGVPARVPDPPPDLKPPGRIKRAWRWWLGKAGRIAGKQNRILSWLAFYVGLWSVAWWMRVRKQDRLDRATRPVGDTGWNARTEPIHTDPRRVRRPF